MTARSIAWFLVGLATFGVSFLVARETASVNPRILPYQPGSQLSNPVVHSADGSFRIRDLAAGAQQSVVIVFTPGCSSWPAPRKRIQVE